VDEAASVNGVGIDRSLVGSYSSITGD